MIVKTGTSIGRVRDAFAAAKGICGFKLLYEGEEVLDDDTFGELGIKAGDSVQFECLVQQSGC